MPSLKLFTTPALLAASIFGCSPQGGGAGPGTAASGGASTGGASGMMGGVVSTGGSTNSGTGGGISAPASGGANVVATGGTTGSGGTGGSGTPRGTGGSGTPRGTGGGAGNYDDGHLFTDAGLVTFSGGATGTDAAVSGSMDAASVPPGSGHTATCSIPAVGLTAVFTQTGIDVTVVITATKCPAGSHVIQIHDGFSCDSASTQGGVWGGKRGDGIGSITCNASQQGTLTHTRPGTDANTNWTVGDHSTKTDVTLHPMMLESNCGTFF